MSALLKYIQTSSYTEYVFFLGCFQGRIYVISVTVFTNSDMAMLDDGIYIQITFNLSYLISVQLCKYNLILYPISYPAVRMVNALTPTTR